MVARLGECLFVDTWGLGNLTSVRQPTSTDPTGLQQRSGTRLQLGDRSYTTTSKGEPRENPSRYYKTYWRTQQMSDHLPMWVELKIDYSDAYLNRQLSDCDLPEEDYLPEDLQ